MSEPYDDDMNIVRPSTVQKQTPLHDITWYVKWIGTIMLVFAVSARSCLLYTSPSPRDGLLSRMPSSA